MELNIGIKNLYKAVIEGIRENNVLFENRFFELFEKMQHYGDLGSEQPDIKFSIYVDAISDIIMQIRGNRGVFGKKGEEIERLDHYVKKVINFKYNRYLRSKIKERKTLTYIEDIPHFDVPDSLLDIDSSESIQIFINEAMDTISDKCRNLLKAKYVDGLKFEEIAVKLKLASTGAARVKKHDCLKSLRVKNKDIIKKYYE